MPYSEHSLARGVLEGDPEAIDRVSRWISAVLTWPRFWSLRGQWPDLLQESLTQVIESLQRGRFDSSKDLRFYVQGIARHIAIRAIRESVRRQRRMRESAIQGALLVEDPSLAESIALRQLVRRVLDEASEECAALLRLYFLEGMGYEEISQELMLPIGTVKSRLFRCLQGARRALRFAIRRNQTGEIDE